MKDYNTWIETWKDFPALKAAQMSQGTGRKRIPALTARATRDFQIYCRKARREEDKQINSIFQNSL